MNTTIKLPSIQEMFPEHLLSQSASPGPSRPFPSPSRPTTSSLPRPDLENPMNATFGVLRPSLSSRHTTPVHAPQASVHDTSPQYTSGQLLTLSPSDLTAHVRAIRPRQKASTHQPGQFSGVFGRQSSPGSVGSEDDEDFSDAPRRHVCTMCNKRFNRPSSLRIHLNTHTGATPFRCPWPNCGREFNVNSNMRRHYRNHSSSAGVFRTETPDSLDMRRTRKPGPLLPSAIAPLQPAHLHLLPRQSRSRSSSTASHGDSSSSLSSPISTDSDDEMAGTMVHASFSEEHCMQSAEPQSSHVSVGAAHDFWRRKRARYSPQAFASTSPSSVDCRGQNVSSRSLSLTTTLEQKPGWSDPTTPTAIANAFFMPSSPSLFHPYSFTREG